MARWWRILLSCLEFNFLVVVRLRSSCVPVNNPGLFKKIPSFGWVVAGGMARRLLKVSGQISLPDYQGGALDEQVAGRLLPVPFIERHRLLPLAMKDNLLTVGYVDDPDPSVIKAI